MPKLDRYLTREFTQSVFAAMVVLGLVSLGGVFADLLGEIARGKVPAGLLLSQLGLRLVDFLPILLPLSLMLGLLLALGRLYRDSEMPVLASVGIGPGRMLRPLMLVTLPIVAVIALCALWLGPTAKRLGDEMVYEANRNLLITGLEPGKFTALPNNGGIVYVGGMSADGRTFTQMFVHRLEGDRVDVSTSASGSLSLEGDGSRYLRLDDGFRVEGSPGTLDYRMMHFERNEIRVPDREAEKSMDDFKATSTIDLLRQPGGAAAGELHWRIGLPLFAVLLGLLAMPMARSEPRTPRYGRLVAAGLAYLFGMNMLIIGVSKIAGGAMPGWLGLWWLHVPALALGAWLFWRDGRPPRVAALPAAKSAGSAR